MNLKNELCEIEIEANPNRLPQRANHYFGVKLIAGIWPEDKALITACDNNSWVPVSCHFGGKVERITEKQKYVTVYVD